MTDTRVGARALSEEHGKSLKPKPFNRRSRSAQAPPRSPGIAPVERVAQLRSLAALAAVFLGSAHPLVEMLRAAKRDDEAAMRALHMIDRVPPLTRRRTLATFCRVTCGTGPRGVRGIRRNATATLWSRHDDCWARR